MTGSNEHDILFKNGRLNLNTKGEVTMFVKPKIKEIQKKRKKLGLSKHQVSLKAGLGGSSLSRIETGTTKHIHPLRARAIAEMLQCDVEDIFEEVRKGV